MKRFFPAFLVVFFGVTFFVSSCSEQKSDYEQVLHDPLLYNHLSNKLNYVIIYDIFTPPVGDRVFAYSNLAAYEVLAHSGKRSSLQHKVMDLHNIPKPDSTRQIDFPFASMIAYLKVGDALTFSGDTMRALTDSIKGLAKKHGMPKAMFEASVSYGNQVADFYKTVEAYTGTSVAIYDAFICCWFTKYKFDLIRPESYINKYIDPNWMPYLQTPPFPEYNSAHSTISAAAATVLTELFDNTAFKDSSERNWGWPDRHFQSVDEAAIEVSLSRFYGGIHYKPSVETAYVQGKKIGNLVLSKLQNKSYDDFKKPKSKNIFPDESAMNKPARLDDH